MLSSSIIAFPHAFFSHSSNAVEYYESAAALHLVDREYPRRGHSPASTWALSISRTPATAVRLATSIMFLSSAMGRSDEDAPSKRLVQQPVLYDLRVAATTGYRLVGCLV